MDEIFPVAICREFRESDPGGNPVGDLRKSGGFTQEGDPDRRDRFTIHRGIGVGNVEKGHFSNSDFELDCQWFCGDPDPAPGDS